MDQKQMIKQMLALYKAAFDNSFSTMAMMQEQAERMVAMFLEQAAYMPKESKQAVEEWLKLYRKGREEYKTAVDESYRKVEAFLVGAEQGKSE